MSVLNLVYIVRSITNQGVQPDVAPFLLASFAFSMFQTGTLLSWRRRPHMYTVDYVLACAGRKLYTICHLLEIWESKDILLEKHERFDRLSTFKNKITLRRAFSAWLDETSSLKEPRVPHHFPEPVDDDRVDDTGRDVCADIRLDLAEETETLCCVVSKPYELLPLWSRTGMPYPSISSSKLRLAVKQDTSRSADSARKASEGLPDPIPPEDAESPECTSDTDSVPETGAAVTLSATGASVVFSPDEDLFPDWPSQSLPAPSSSMRSHIDSDQELTENSECQSDEITEISDVDSAGVESESDPQQLVLLPRKFKFHRHNHHWHGSTRLPQLHVDWCKLQQLTTLKLKTFSSAREIRASTPNCSRSLHDQPVTSTIASVRARRGRRSGLLLGDQSFSLVTTPAEVRHYTTTTIRAAKQQVNRSILLLDDLERRMAHLHECLNSLNIYLEQRNPDYCIHLQHAAEHVATISQSDEAMMNIAAHVSDMNSILRMVPFRCELNYAISPATGTNDVMAQVGEWMEHSRRGFCKIVDIDWSDQRDKPFIVMYRDGQVHHYSEVSLRKFTRGGRVELAEHMHHPTRGVGQIIDIDWENLRGKPFLVRFESGGETHHYSTDFLSKFMRSHSDQPVEVGERMCHPKRGMGQVVNIDWSDPRQKPFEVRFDEVHRYSMASLRKFTHSLKPKDFLDDLMASMSHFNERLQQAEAIASSLLWVTMIVTNSSPAENSNYISSRFEHLDGWQPFALPDTMDSGSEGSISDTEHGRAWV